MKGPIDLALVWHFHQPDYTDPRTGAPAMPWTRLHALKDYADMAAHVARHPGVRVTFNVVPTLLDQLVRLADGSAPPDPFLALATKPAEELTPEERTFVVGHFFSLNRDRMAGDLRRYEELAALRGHAAPNAVGGAEVARFDDQALRDLQVLFHVAWSGSLLQADPVVARLRRKGRGFDESEKAELFAVHRAFLADVIPRWRRLADDGRVELSVSPYYHPILPLLCDTASALESVPDLPLPSSSFRHPEDASLQLERAMTRFEALFGRRAAGGWPSEGAISEAALARLAEAGYGWAASDEDLLFASLGSVFPADRATADAQRAALLYRPWRHGEGPVLLFRDHDLSDRIGFAYSGRPPAEAARDFADRLRRIRESLPDDGLRRVVTVILDGENAWEHYPDHATPFFDAFYGTLAEDPGVRTVTASEAAAPADASPLPQVTAGSWIYRSLATWIGHAEKNRGWELLAAARDAVEAARGPLAWDEPAWRAILAAEGSDWFWWYGDDHPTEYGAEFDLGFREKLRVAYTAAGLAAPASLDEPVKGAGLQTASRPSGPVTARIDGRVSDYFEWLAAGRVRVVHGAMHAATRLARDLWFGSDDDALYVRLDPFEPGSFDGADVRIRVPSGQAVEAAETALDRILEMRIPLAGLGGAARFAVEIKNAAGAVQRVPADGFIDVVVPDRFDWSA
ncbi:MAG TPA: glycoside hydrolase family 57 protein [Candidatus Polarisedimenticolaceae bacterium]|nr:glycoside hydrolase family 57 protein [Candidatus Polarisedimenticolaceae bacterium]